MTPDQAAMVIQDAWRAFVDDRRAQAYEAYMAELNANYYAGCYEPVDNDDDCYYDYNTETWVKW